MGVELALPILDPAFRGHGGPAARSDMADDAFRRMAIETVELRASVTETCIIVAVLAEYPRHATPSVSSRRQLAGTALTAARH